MSGRQSCTFPLLLPDGVGDPQLRPRLERAVTSGLVASGVVAILAWIFIAIVHVDDRYHVGWAEGSRTALARSAAGGVLFPPLYDGHFYGGTRFMPGPTLLHASLARLTGEYLVSGKLIAYLSTIALLAVMFVVLRQAGCTVAAALALSAGVLVTVPGLLAATTVEGDALAVALQLTAVALIRYSQRRVATVGAAILCALALATKLTSLWALLAVAGWLLFRDPRRLRLFAPIFLVILTLEVVLFQALSSNRMLTDLREVTFAGVGGAAGFVQSPMRTLSLVADGAPLVLILFPLALLGLDLLGREVSIWLVCLFCSSLVLLIVMADAGALYNHLIDLVALTLIAAGDLWARLEPSQGRMSIVGGAIAIVVIWALAVSFLLEVRPDLEEAGREALGSKPARYDAHPLAHELVDGKTLLSEDPYVPVSLGRRPVVLDGWMLLRLGRDHPSWTSALAGRIEAHEFDEIVLVYPISFSGSYRDTHFGSEVANAIRSSYRFARQTEGYYLYVPRR
jgi:hypothetical protein